MMVEELIPLADVARALKLHPSTVRRACERHKLSGAEKVQTPRGEVWLVPREFASCPWPSVERTTRYHAAVGKPGRRPGAKG